MSALSSFSCHFSFSQNGATGGSTRNSPQILPITGKALPQVKPLGKDRSLWLVSVRPPVTLLSLFFNSSALACTFFRRGASIPLTASPCASLPSPPFPSLPPTASRPHREQQWETDGRGAASAFSSCVKPLAAADNTWWSPPQVQVPLVSVACGLASTGGPPFSSSLGSFQSVACLVPMPCILTTAVCAHCRWRGGVWGQHRRFLTPLPGGRAGTRGDGREAALQHGNPTAARESIGKGLASQGTRGDGREAALQQMAIAATRESIGVGLASQGTSSFSLPPPVVPSLDFPVFEFPAGMSALCFDCTLTIYACVHCRWREGCGVNTDAPPRPSLVAVQGLMAWEGEGGSTAADGNRCHKGEYRGGLGLSSLRMGALKQGRSVESTISLTSSSLPPPSHPTAPCLDHSGVPPSLNSPLPTSQQPQASWRCMALVGTGEQAWGEGMGGGGRVEGQHGSKRAAHSLRGGTLWGCGLWVGCGGWNLRGGGTRCSSNRSGVQSLMDTVRADRPAALVRVSSSYVRGGI
ncbi:unnamed protein product [Closterium sp. NIES-54]